MDTPVIQNFWNMHNLLRLLRTAKNQIIVLRSVKFRAESSYTLDQITAGYEEVTDVVVGTEKI